jgi:hypothetical protein
MWLTKVQDDFRGWIVVGDSNGSLATGLTSASFIVTVRDPADTSSSNPIVSESGKPGLYRFDVTSSFFMSHGVGEYGVVVEVNNGVGIRDVQSNVLKISQNDLDTLASSSTSLLSSQSITNIVSGVWDANMSSHNQLNSAGSLLFSSSVGGIASVDYTAVRDAVWNAQSSAYQISGSLGFITSQLSGTLETISPKIRSLYDMNFGRWKIVSNQMIFYKDDNVTEVARFSLFDDVGSPTMDAVFERIKV